MGKLERGHRNVDKAIELIKDKFKQQNIAFESKRISGFDKSNDELGYRLARIYYMDNPLGDRTGDKYINSALENGYYFKGNGFLFVITLDWPFSGFTGRVHTEEDIAIKINQGGEFKVIVINQIRIVYQVATSQEIIDSITDICENVIDTPNSTTNTNGKEGCYIATCVYGSYDCQEVLTLRRFRDNTLKNSWIGRKFIELYHSISPTIVKLFGKKQWFNKLWQPVLQILVTRLRRCK